MKKTLMLLGLAAGLMALTANISEAKTMTKVAKKAVATKKAVAPVAKTKAPDVLAAAKFAVAEQAKADKIRIRLVKVMSVEKKDDMGATTYTMKLSVKKAGKAAKADAVVSEDAKKKMTLTSWAWEGAMMKK